MDKTTPIVAGKSSFELIDATLLFEELDLKPGMTVYDYWSLQLLDAF